MVLHVNKYKDIEMYLVIFFVELVVFDLVFEFQILFVKMIEKRMLFLIEFLF